MVACDRSAATGCRVHGVRRPRSGDRGVWPGGEGASRLGRGAAAAAESQLPVLMNMGERRSSGACPAVAADYKHARKARLAGP